MITFMIHKTVKHIHRFRVYFLAFIVVAFFYELGLNPINKLALELKQKEERLDQREKDLNDREKELVRSSAWNDNMYLFMGGGIVVLFVLALANFYMDIRRRKLEIRK